MVPETSLVSAVPDAAAPEVEEPEVEEPEVAEPAVAESEVVAAPRAFALGFMSPIELFLEPEVVDVLVP